MAKKWFSDLAGDLPPGGPSGEAAAWEGPGYEGLDDAGLMCLVRKLPEDDAWEAFRVLFGRFHDLLLALAAAFLERRAGKAVRRYAEDLVQTCERRLWDARQQWAPSQPVRDWMTGCLFNLCTAWVRDRPRKRRKKSAKTGQPGAATAPPGNAAGLSPQDRRELIALLDRVGQAAPTAGAPPATASPGAWDADLDAALDDFLRKQLARGRRKCRRQLACLLEDLAARIGATCGWIVVREGDRLKALESYRAPAFELAVGDRSIVGRVYATRQPYRSGDLARDPYYHRVVEGARSAISIPVLATVEGESKVISVLHYECLEPDAFSEWDEVRLQALSTDLVLSLLVWRRADTTTPAYNVVLNPMTDGWQAEEVHLRLLRALARPLARGTDETYAPSLALWTVDHTKSRSWVVAAHGYGREYLAERMLPEGSLVEKVARRGNRAEAVRYTNPRTDEEFKTKNLALRRGLRWAVYVPVVWPEDSEGGPGTGWARCVLAIYFYEDDFPEPYLSRSFLACLGDRLGGMFQDLRDQRRELAVAYLEQSLAHEGSTTQLFRARQVLQEVFTVQQLSIYVRDEGLLYPAETTGLLPGQADGGLARQAAYNVHDKDHWGLTTWLGSQPGRTLRKHDVMAAHEAGVDRDCPPPRNRYCEAPCVSTLENRRFLGVGIGSAAGEPLGVVRMVRPATAAPFRHTDEDLLARLAPHMAPAFEAWLRQYVGKGAPSLGTAPAPAAPTAGLWERELDRELQRLCKEFDHYQPVAAYFHALVLHNDEEVQLNLLQQHPRPGPREQWPDAPVKIGTRALGEHFLPEQLSLSRGAAYVISAREVLLPATEPREFLGPFRHRYVSLLRMPMLGWWHSCVVEGIVSVLAAPDVQPGWGEEEVRQLLAAGARLAAIFAGGSAPPCELGQHTPGEDDTLSQLVDRFRLQARQLAHADAVHLWLPSDRDSRGTVAAGWLSPLDYARAHGLPLAEMHGLRHLRNADRLGLRISTDGQSARLPLRHGSLTVGELSWSPLREPFWERPWDIVKGLAALGGAFARRTVGDRRVVCSCKRPVAAPGCLLWMPRVSWSEEAHELGQDLS